MAENNNRQPATKGDLVALKTELKRDLASKSDLVAVKTELKRDLASKSDLADAVTGLRTELKADIAAVDTGLKAEITAVKADIKELDQKIERVYLSQVQADAKLDQKMDKMIDKIDKIYSDITTSYEKTAAKGAMYDQKAATHAGMLLEHTDELSKHENRITLLETKK